MSSTDDTCVPIVVSKKYNLIEYRYFILDVENFSTVRVQYHVRVLVDQIEPSPIKGMNRRLLTVRVPVRHAWWWFGWFYGCRFVEVELLHDVERDSL